MSNDIIIYKNEPHESILIVLDSLNAVYNLTGYSISAQIRRNATSTEYIAFTGSILDSSLGKISLTLTNNQTTLMSGKYSYDVFIISATYKYKVTDGFITIITR